MFIVLLKFADNRDQASQFMDGHRDWLQQGFDDGVFLLAGSLQPGLGGGILAHNSSREAMEARVHEDPFVVNDVVSAEVLELSAAKAGEQLAFLLD